jgi:hypothetical protein
LLVHLRLAGLAEMAVLQREHLLVQVLLVVQEVLVVVAQLHTQQV